MNKIDCITQSGILTQDQLDTLQDLKKIYKRMEKIEWNQDIEDYELLSSIDDFIGRVHCYVGKKMMSSD